MRFAKVVTGFCICSERNFISTSSRCWPLAYNAFATNVSKNLTNWNTGFHSPGRLWLTPRPPLPALELSVDKCSSACFVPEISFYNGTCTLGHLYPGGQPHFTELLSVHQALVQLCQFCLHLQYFQRVWRLNYVRRLEGSNPCTWL